MWGHMDKGFLRDIQMYINIYTYLTHRDDTYRGRERGREGEAGTGV